MYSWSQNYSLAENLIQTLTSTKQMNGALWGLGIGGSKWFAMAVLRPETSLGLTRPTVPLSISGDSEISQESLQLAPDLQAER